MLKGERFTSLYDCSKAAVFTGGNNFPWFEIYWSTAMTASYALSNYIHYYAFICSRFMISLATITPEAEAWINPLVTPAPSPMVNIF